MADHLADEPGPQPEPQAESPQLTPGGTDALDDPKYGDMPWPPATRDRSPEANPAVDEALPGDVGRSEDKQQEGADSDPSDEDSTDEPPA